MADSKTKLSRERTYHDILNLRRFCCRDDYNSPRKNHDRNGDCPRRSHSIACNANVEECSDQLMRCFFGFGRSASPDQQTVIKRGKNIFLNLRCEI